MSLSRVTIVAALFALAACAPEPEETPASTPAAPAAADAAAAPAATPASSDMQVVPAQITSCAGEIATVKWDFSKSHADVAVVEIYVGPADAPTLFASGGNTGEASTGAWTVPTTLFIARDKATGTELGTVAATGPACPAAG